MSTKLLTYEELDDFKCNWRSIDDLDVREIYNLIENIRHYKNEIKELKKEIHFLHSQIQVLKDLRDGKL